MAPDKILVIITGGTIDGCLEKDKVENRASSIPSYVRTEGICSDCEFRTLFMKDSRGITGKDREKILDAVKKSDCKMAIITHGTFTMVETAKYLKANLRAPKTIVLTGSLAPLGSFNSDAPGNLKFAFSSARKLGSGVYICMNGKAFNPDNVVKNDASGKFEEIA